MNSAGANVMLGKEYRTSALTVQSNADVAAGVAVPNKVTGRGADGILALVRAGAGTGPGRLEDLLDLSA